MLFPLGSLFLATEKVNSSLPLQKADKMLLMLDCDDAEALVRQELLWPLWLFFPFFILRKYIQDRCTRSVSRSKINNNVFVTSMSPASASLFYSVTPMSIYLHLLLSF